MEKIQKLVITRHPALVDYLLEQGIISVGEFKLITHATADDVRGQDVIGVLPLSLASCANSVTEIPLALTPEMRGRELSLDEIREIAGELSTYKVVKL